MSVDIPVNVKKIMDKLHRHGFEAYIVGGSVRDILRGVNPKDWDITTSATPREVVEIFSRTVETGIKHGTVTVLVEREHYEVTTYRIDGEYLDGRRPEEVTFTGEIVEDLSRRDFTINAIAYNPDTGFVDPFDGKIDIKRKIIRCVGDPLERFGEDALRMLRAIRFAGQLGFAIDASVVEAIAIKRANLANISRERVREEFVKLLVSPHVQAVKLLETTGLLRYIVPFFKSDVDHVIDLLKNCPAKEPLRLALFLASIGDFGENCAEILKNLRFDNKTTHEVSQYVRLLHSKIPHDRYRIKKYLRQMPQAEFENLLNLQAITDPKDAERLANVCKESQDIQAKGECYTLRNLSIKGNDLIAMGIPKGKALGDMLESLLDAVMRDPSLNKLLPSKLHEYL